ncbi:PREDICTED: uncharacterized protein LOC109210143 [Nicotiana attenuata]|uniref:uncharacterized protein LOC109210143 n=1 Tax=Nicotiana attenuata TaxID=49451 RepID=UPI000904F925|nr:PREDICTED: uncharacterized protein LOC109210143 [Nicotiana attenuata]
MLEGLRKRFAQAGTNSAHCSPDDEENDGEESALVPRARKPIEAAKPSELETSSCGEGTPKKDATPVSSEVEIVPLPSSNMPEGVNADTPKVNENALSDELGAMTTGHSLSLPTYSEGAIEEANTLRMPDPNKVLEEDPFQSCFAGIDDTIDLNDASALFEEAQYLLSRFRAKLSQCEVELKKVSGEKRALRLLCSQKEEELKALRTELAKAQKNEAELDEQVTVISTRYGLLGSTSEAKTTISQLQQKLAVIGQLRSEVDQVKADCHRWKKNMDQLAADKEAVTDQLASAETRLQGIEAKGLAQAKKIEELGAELARAQAKAVQAKAEAEKTKAVAEKSIAMYLRDVTAGNELAKCRARRETLEEIHARGFNLAEEIAEAKARETNARFLDSSDDEDVESGSGDGEGEEDVLEGEEAPEDRAAEGAAHEDGALGDMTSKID